LAMKKIFYLIVFVVILSGCKKLYEPNIDSPTDPYRYLGTI